MYIIEFHDDDLAHSQGSHAGTLGRGGAIAYAYQVEMHMQDEQVGYQRWRRAYAIYGSREVGAVWARNDDGTMQYVARNPDYNGEWQLPFLYGPATELVTGRLGEDATSLDDAKTWAQAAFGANKRLATAVILDAAHVFAAWERTPDGIVLIAQSPSKPE